MLYLVEYRNPSNMRLVRQETVDLEAHEVAHERWLRQRAGLVVDFVPNPIRRGECCGGCGDLHALCGIIKDCTKKGWQVR